MADIAFTNRAEKGIGDRVTQNIRIGMSIESAIVRNFDAAENQFSARRETMRVVPSSTPDHAR